MCNVSDYSFWLNLVVHTNRLVTNQGRAFSFSFSFRSRYFQFPLYHLFVTLTLPTLQLLMLDFSTASRTPTKHVNKIIGWNGETYYNLRQEVVSNCVDQRFITKCCNPCYKMRSFHLLQNAVTLITKCASYYKMRRYYKMPQNIRVEGTTEFTSCLT